ncbi:hypothetical protein MPH_01060 [Macrophomina phaseolina MS6]|uniref:Beta/gamma crystallin n=2 Tax=Macrophomina phaseolina TaxID=35725 RepID=K2RGG5_MACPH|nr:hypothetical protein MPH_01060 [Macrophomina phaseolina MS6]KAH7021782.1 hypothetical protein B0J12DRAFT_388960 [Macrophomina phaseolina]
MQYLTALAAAIVPFVAITAAAPPTANLPNGFVKRDVGQVTFCTGENYTGECLTQTYTTNRCIVLPAPYNKNVKTFVPDHGNLVRVTNSAESCTMHGDLFLEWPGSIQFNNFEGVDYSNATSFLVQQCDNCA